MNEECTFQPRTNVSRDIDGQPPLSRPPSGFDATVSRLRRGQEARTELQRREAQLQRGFVKRSAVVRDASGATVVQPFQLRTDRRRPLDHQPSNRAGDARYGRLDGADSLGSNRPSRNESAQPKVPQFEPVQVSPSSQLRSQRLNEDVREQFLFE